MISLAPGRVLRTWRKIAAIFSIYLSECFAYPASSIIWVIADAQLAILLPAVWLAAGSGQQMIAGLPRSELITYYLVSMTLSQFVTCHLMWDIAWDIREGDFTASLVRPLPYFTLSVGRNFAWRIAKLFLFLPIAAVVYTLYLSHNSASPLHFSWEFVASIFLGQFLSFAASYCLAMVTFWTVEFLSVLRLYGIFEMFLSGRLFPISAFPKQGQQIANMLHFRYTNYFPCQMLLGNLKQAEIYQGLGLQLAWIVFFAILGRILFERGVRRYSGVGM